MNEKTQELPVYDPELWELIRCVRQVQVKVEERAGPWVVYRVETDVRSHVLEQVSSYTRAIFNQVREEVNRA
jgi:hypothetical protein